jgi:hypothetical protein
MNEQSKCQACSQVELIAAAVRHKQEIISCMGAGGKLSPQLVQVRFTPHFPVPITCRQNEPYL